MVLITRLNLAPETETMRDFTKCGGDSTKAQLDNERVGLTTSLNQSWPGAFRANLVAGAAIGGPDFRPGHDGFGGRRRSWRLILARMRTSRAMTI